MKKITKLLFLGLITGMLCSCNLIGEKGPGNHLNDYYVEEEIFHDQADVYMSPLEPKGNEEVTYRIKVKRNTTTSAKIWIKKASSLTYSPIDMVFEKADSNNRYEYWKVTVPASAETYNYHFSLTNNVETIYFNRQGLDVNEITNTGGDWSTIPNFSTPDWAKGTVWYSIMPDSFSNGNILNDKTSMYANPWGSYHQNGSGYFGGDLQGIENKIDYIQDLGAESVFVNPIWITTHQAGYGSFDFTQFDSTFGDDEQFRDLVSALHDEDMTIMLDAVFEYCNVSNILYNSSGLYPNLDDTLNPDSPYYDFVQRDENGNVIYSGWGSPLIDFSSEITRNLLYRNPDSVMQYYIREFDIDGWRMDVGNDLRGTDPDNFGDSTSILKDMRKYIKELDEDVLFLSEHANGDQFDFCLDSKWNYSFGYAIRDWAQGLSNPAVLLNTLESGVINLPRSVANASYNFLTTHDLPRFMDIITEEEFETATQESIFNAANQLQYTFVGSPSIFYGEEIGLQEYNVIDDETPSPFFNSMKWNKDGINYEIYNRARSLGKLHNEYREVFRDGAYLRLYSETTNDNKEGVMAFGRFNKHGKVVSIINPSNTVKSNFNIDVSLMDIKDGSILTDYFSGKQYKVKNGIVTVDVYEGGIVLVDGDVNNNIVGNFNVVSLGNVNPNLDLTTNLDSLALRNQGSVAGTSDSGVFAYKLGFNNTAFSTKLTNKSSYSIVARSSLDEDASFYGVYIDKTKGRVFYRSSDGAKISYGKTFDVAEGDTVEITRGNDNLFTTRINNTEYNPTYINAEFEIYCGVINFENTTFIYDFEVRTSAQQLSTHFEHNLGSLLYTDSEYEILNSFLTLKGSANEPAKVSMPYEATDFTVKTSLSFAVSNGNYAGITIGDNNNNYIFLGKKGDNKVTLSQVVNGAFVDYYSVNYNANTVVLQLELVAGEILGYIINGNNATYVGKIPTNFSEIYISLISNNSVAKFDYFSLGDDINGSGGDADFVQDDNLGVNLTSSSTETRWSIVNGKWEYIKGGIKQVDANASKAKYVLSNYAQNDFVATFSLNGTFTNNESYMGAIFGLSSMYSTEGYLMAIYKNGLVKFYDHDVERASYQIDNFEEGKDYTFQIKYAHNVAAFYINENDFMFAVSDLYKTGYFSFIGEQTVYSIISYGVYGNRSNFTVYGGTANTYINDANPNYTDIEVISNGTNPGYISISEQKMSHFVMSFNLQLVRTNVISRAYARVYIGNSFGGNSYHEGLVVQFNDRGELSIIADGETKVENAVIQGLDTGSCYIVLAYQGSKLEVYTANFKADGNYGKKDISLSYTYNDSYHRSGVLSLYAKNASARFGMLRTAKIDTTENYADHELFNYYYIEEKLPGEPEIVNSPYTQEYFNDFSSRQSIGDFTRYSGAVSVKDGTMIVDGTNGNNWDAGAGFAKGTFSNYKLTCKVKPVNDYGFGAIEINKAAPSVNHQQAALTILITKTSGELYLGNDVKYKDEGGNECPIAVRYDSNGYCIATIICNNGKLSINLGDPNSTLVVNIPDLERNNDLLSGFISLNAGANKVLFDDLRITPGEFEIAGGVEVPDTLFTGTFSTDFSTPESLDTFVCYGGSTSLENGMFKLDGKGSNYWDAGAVFSKGTLENFILNIDFTTSSGGFTAIEFNKTSPKVNHQGSAITVLCEGSTAKLFVGQDTFVDGFVVDLESIGENLYNLKLTVNDGVVTITSGVNEFSMPISSFPRNNNLLSGYLSLNAGNSVSYFDNITITTL